MDTTSTMNLQRYTVGESHQLESKHMEHDPNLNHSNKSIQPDLTHLNNHIVVNGSLDDTLKQTYSDFINNYNQQLKLQKESGKLSDYNYQKRLKTLNGETGGKKKPVVEIVSTLGNVDSTLQLLDMLKIPHNTRYYLDENNNQVAEPHVQPSGEQQWADINNMAMEEYINWFNENTAFNIAQGWTHLDEWSPHIHMEAVVAGHTASGKLSSNPNNAIRESLEMNGITPSNDTRDNLRKFRKLTDTRLIAFYNDALSQYNINLSLVRSGRHGGQSMTDYKADQAKLQQIQNDRLKLNKQKKQQQAQQQLLDNREKQLQSDIAKWKKNKQQIQHDNAIAQQSIDNYIKEVREWNKDSSITTISEANERLMKNHNVIMQNIKQQQKHHDDLVKQNANIESTIKSRLNSVVKRENDVSERENAVQKRESNINNWAVSIVETIWKMLRTRLIQWLDEQKDTIRQKAINDYKNQIKINQSQQQQETIKQADQLLNNVKPDTIKMATFRTASDKKVSSQMDRQTPPDGTEELLKDSSPTNHKSKIGRAASSHDQNKHNNDSDDLEF